MTPRTLPRVGALLGALLALIVVASEPVLAKTHQATIGNYYFQDEATKSRKQLVVTKGDQVVFTNVEGVYPPHTVDVDELDVHSGAILQGQTYTTPPLNKVGNFLLYCDPHRERGHTARLIVNAPPAKGPATTRPQPTTGAQPQPTNGTAGSMATPMPSGAVQVVGPLQLEPLRVATPQPAAALEPGIGTADPVRLAQAEPNPDSLEGLLGRDFGGRPWTRAVWWLGLASLPVVAAAALALVRHNQLTAAGQGAERPAARARPARKPASQKAARGSAQKPGSKKRAPAKKKSAKPRGRPRS